MAITVSCGCGRSYQLKDELAGRLVTCPACGATIRAPEQQRAAQADPIFDRDKFLLRQKHLAINEKYHVWDEQGQELLFVERPVYLLKTIAAIVAAVFVAAIGTLATVFVGIALFPSRPNAGMAQPQEISVREIAAVVVILITVVATIFAAVAVAIWIRPRRHVYFYRDEGRGAHLLQVLQDKKFWVIMATYSVLDASGGLLATLHKNYLYNLFRKRWVCRRPDGATLCVAQEDSIILSLLRRLLGTLYGVLRTNYIIQRGDSDEVIGEFNRKFTVFDRYVLDLTNDPARSLDRRVAIALGVMLDTGERR